MDDFLLQGCDRPEARPAHMCEGVTRHSLAGQLAASGSLRQFVATIVVGVRCMAFGPRPFRLMPGNLLVQLLPQVLIRDRFLARGAPAVGLPAMNVRN